MGFLKIGTVDDVWSGEITGVMVGGIPVLLINVDGVLRAYSDVCPHLGTSLSRGSLKNGILTCATHQWQFDGQTGCGINPRNACLESLPLKIEAGDIFLDIENVERTTKRAQSHE